MAENIRIIELTAQNLDAKHIGCAIGSNADARLCANAKKDWMRAAFKEGYRFHRLDARGKAFIETVPGQYAWAPIEADNWLYIECFWVSGSLKGHGHAARLLQVAQQRAVQEGFYGLCALGSPKKQHFLSDPGFYRHHGFEAVDTTPPYFELLALPMQKNAAPPRFKNEENRQKPAENGVDIWYSHHCPHTVKYIPLLQKAAEGCGAPFTTHLLAGRAEARTAPSPFTTWAMFHNGKFVTNEIFSEGKLVKFLEGK